MTKWTKSTKCDSNACIEVAALPWQRSTRCDGGSCVEVAAWQRSTKCEQGACVEVGWNRSTRCDNASCVEVHQNDDDMIGVRNSKIPGEVVWFDQAEWKAFREGILAGEFAFDA